MLSVKQVARVVGTSWPAGVRATPKVVLPVSNPALIIQVRNHLNLHSRAIWFPLEFVFTFPLQSNRSTRDLYRNRRRVARRVICTIMAKATSCLSVDTTYFFLVKAQCMCDRGT